jgi:Ca2+-transporting ATPase
MITEILKKKGEIVAITGDGINDVLALKAADIGVAMGQRGTDVARDVSDIILVNDNFASIVKGIREGRKTYDNIKKFTKYLLAVNFSEIVLILVTLFMLSPLPFLPLQILWLNLISDSIPAIALIFEKEDNVMKTKPRKEKSILNGIWKFILIAGIINFAADFAVYLIGLYQNIPIAQIRTMVLTSALFFELFFIYACRSKKQLFKIGIFSNKWLNLAVLVSVILQLILIYTPFGSLFGVVPLSLGNWLILLPISMSGLIIFEIAKFIKTKNGDILEDGD